MNKRKITLMIKATFVVVFSLFMLNNYVVLSSTFLDCVEFSNTPIHKVLALSDGKHVSLMGVPSMVFSLTGNEIVFEQSVPCAEQYVSVLKGDCDTLFAVTRNGTLDIYSYDQLDGLHLLSSTDLSDPADRALLPLHQHSEDLHLQMGY